MRGIVMAIFTGIVLILSVLAGARQASAPQQSNPQPGNQAASPQEIQEFNQARVAELSKQIAGKENQPAGEVFKNVKILTGVPAGRLLKIMQLGYSASLGVKCTHCHVPGGWEKDDKAEKQIARDMMKMNQTINNDLLKNIEGLKKRNAIVNCTTCHRGQIKPALDLGATGGK